MTGLSFQPFDVQMGLMEASKGRVSPTVRRALLYCFTYDPARQAYTFNIIRVAGTASGVGVLLVVGGLIIARRRRRGP